KIEGIYPMPPSSRRTTHESPLKKGTLGGLAVVTGVVLAACGRRSSSSSSTSSSTQLRSGAAKGTVVVGSANFPENELLAEIYILALQGKGIKVTPKLNIGSRDVY